VPSPVSVVTAKFEDLVAVGLRQLISEDPYLELVAADVEIEHVEQAIAEYEPAVAVLNFGSLKSAAQVFQLHDAHPETRIVVLANRPTSGE
jgi:DNA-binding NarL/FixJ family response regulator